MTEGGWPALAPHLLRLLNIIPWVRELVAALPSISPLWIEQRLYFVLGVHYSECSKLFLAFPSFLLSFYHAISLHLFWLFLSVTSLLYGWFVFYDLVYVLLDHCSLYKSSYFGYNHFFLACCPWLVFSQHLSRKLMKI